MKTAEVLFPDRPEIDASLRGRKILVRYEIMVSDGSTITSEAYVGDQKLEGYASSWFLGYVARGRPLEELAENAAPVSLWPKDAQWD